MLSFKISMKNVIYVFGTSGVGKTTLLSKLIDEFSDKVEYVSFGSLMFDIAKAKFNIQSRDDLRTLNREDYYKIFEEAVLKLEEIVALTDKKAIVIDTHILIDTHFGTFIGTPKYLIKKVEPSAVVVISAKTEEIIERAKKDTTRKRDDLLDYEKVQKRLELTLFTAFIIAYQTHALFKEVINRQGKVEEAYEELKSFVSQFLE